MVLASSPVVSVRRFAGRPVGAQSRYFTLLARRIIRIEFTFIRVPQFQIGPVPPEKHRNGTGLVSHDILRLNADGSRRYFGFAVIKRGLPRGKHIMVDFVVSLFTFVFYAHHSTVAVLD
jgi:hypothetical protein